jgi:nicotinamidase-related amidase
MSVLLDAERSLVLLIDLQLKLMPAIHGNSAVLSQSLKLAKLARLFEIPVLATEHCGDKIGGLEPDIQPLCDQIIEKRAFDACQSKGLFAGWPQGREQVVIAGVETHICLFQTAASLLERGYKVTVMVDATSSRRPHDRDMAIASLARAGARLATTEQAGFEWAGDADHPRFRDLLGIIKQL